MQEDYLITELTDPPNGINTPRALKPLSSPRKYNYLVRNKITAA
jgi:hypothetical protein